MAKEKLTSEDIKVLESIIQEITDEAKKVVEDYTKNPSEISGSTIEIHEDSPYMMESIPDEMAAEGKWKKVMKAPIEEVMKQMTEHNKKVQKEKKKLGKKKKK